MADVRKRAKLHTKLKNYLDAINNHGTVPLSYTVACENMTRVSEVWGKFEPLQEKLEATAADDQAYDIQVAAGEEVEKTFSDVRGKLRSLIKAMETRSAGSQPATSSTAVKLPTISLPTFDGKFSEWTSFKDLFEAAIANNNEISGAQKLQYLKTTLRGEPSNLVKYLTTTDTNYTEAWRILTERYDNKREIVQSLVSKMLDAKPARSECARELQLLLDLCLESLRSLKVLGCPTDKWDDLLIVIIVKKLDPVTRREWAKSLTGNDLPTFAKLETFLTSYIRGLQAAGTPQFHSSERKGERQVKVHHAASEAGHCPTCSGSHHLQECKEFLSKSASDRSAMVKRSNLCFNCLRGEHMIRNCQSPRKCKKCGGKHHTLLHEDKRDGQRTGSLHGARSAEKNKEADNDTSVLHASVSTEGVLMTAIVHVMDKFGVLQPCRVFIDPGAQGDFILENCSNRLGLIRRSSRVNVRGFCDAPVGTSKGKVTTKLYSKFDSKVRLEVDLHVMLKLTGNLPSVKCRGTWKHLDGLQLADPRWYDPAPVDIVLGVRYFHKLLLHQRRLGRNDNDPVAWETVFGWMISGACPADQSKTIPSYHISVDPLQDQLKKFWEVEEPPKKRIMTKDEKLCEEHFLKTYSRDEMGRFTVGVPFTEKRWSLGNSKQIAFRRLQQVERRLMKKPELYLQYKDFMKEYEDLGHMQEVQKEDRVEQKGVTNYLCHHFVVNESSSTTKLRVVFDASAATTTGVSLNDTMLVGATLQDDLYDLLIRFRVHKIVLKSDITKMFRQFKLADEDAKMHRILWRESPSSELKEYQLSTVTYGTACAPNLATRCIQQIGHDTALELPLASQVLLNDTYVDDVLTGQSTTEDAITLYNQLQQAVKTADLQLRKWVSNDEEVLKAIPEELRETKPLVFDEDAEIKALGVQWCPKSDNFKFKCFEFEKSKKLTKRSLLSDIARLFDPLGLISCVTLGGKLLLQELWKLPVHWDDRVPTYIAEQWSEIKEDLSNLPNLIIPRRITVCGSVKVELHGFADASEKSFGAIIYLRSILPNGQVIVRFVTSKTKVAPLRQVRLPRLELGAAVTLAELMAHVIEVLNLDADVYLWSDSTITLQWIAAPPRRWKTYVANRVALIQELTLPSQWSHVAGIENPADLASRGASVRELCNSELWWNGPSWLTQPVLPTFPTCETAEGDKEERVQTVSANFVAVQEHSLLLRFSSLVRLKRCIAWYLRFLHFKMTGVCSKGPLTPSELQEAMLVIVKKIQQQYFSSDLTALRKTKKVPRSSKLKRLFPFIDSSGVMRVSGRLENADLPVQKKHQIIIPKDSHLTTLLIDYYHNSNFHGGFQLTWSQLQTEYWILSGRERVRFYVRSCVRCRRFKAKTAEQLMGDLPHPRVNQCRPFMHTGVDYAGPFVFKDVVGRVPKTYKGYLCLFVCLSTKAIHLEAVSTLSTDGFIAALRRFVARRNLCAHLYSDCGTNFVGAEKELRSVLSNKKIVNSVANELGDRGITWHFNPPASPHRGGIWEAGVKSTKHHLRRVVGSTPLTFEQFTTIICQVEAILNSRPLYAMSPDPSDLQPLTPAHFLMGGPAHPVLDCPLLDIPSNRLSQYQRLQQQMQAFWQRWSSEYLNSLQQRNKWMWERENVKVGDLVLVVEETAPGTWKMGRIQDIHPGKDGRVRVVNVKTACSIYERAINKLVLLLNTDV